MANTGKSLPCSFLIEGKESFLSRNETRACRLEVTKPLFNLGANLIQGLNGTRSDRSSQRFAKVVNGMPLSQFESAVGQKSQLLISAALVQMETGGIGRSHQRQQFGVSLDGCAFFKTGHQPRSDSPAPTILTQINGNLSPPLIGGAGMKRMIIGITDHLFLFGDGDPWIETGNIANPG